MAAEAAVYSYVGISVYFCIPSWWSFGWIFWQSVIVILGRIVGVITVFYGFRMCFKKETISFNELMFITWGGMIRGAIAFGLVLKIPYVGGSTCHNPEHCYSKEQFDLAVSTTLILVFITTLAFGTFMKLFQGWILDIKDEGGDAHSAHSGHTAYHDLVHPNLEKDVPIVQPEHKDPEQSKHKSFAEGAFAAWFLKIDEEVLKPFLIRKYDKVVMEMQEAYNQMIA